VWCAQSAAEQQALANYVATMKRHKHLRAPHRPYDTVVVQLARSTFVPRTPTALCTTAPKQQPSPTVSYVPRAAKSPPVTPAMVPSPMAASWSPITGSTTPPPLPAYIAQHAMSHTASPMGSSTSSTSSLPAAMENRALTPPPGPMMQHLPFQPLPLLAMPPPMFFHSPWSQLAQPVAF
jgi:hypothetical protein